MYFKKCTCISLPILAPRMDLRAGGSGSLNAQERQIGLGDLNECGDIKISTRAAQEFHKYARTDQNR
jgi:hypothetical protein